MAQFQFRRFEYLPTVIKNLILINALVWLGQITFGRVYPLDDMFALHDLHSSLFRPYQLITHLFMHGGFEHIFFNMLALWMFGYMLENVWGPKRFLTFYLICGLGAAAAHLAVLWYQNEQLLNQFHALDPEQRQQLSDAVLQKINEPTLGASGAVFGCLAAFGYLFPNTLILVYFMFPIKAKWLVIIYAVFELFAGVRATAGDNVAHFAHLGGALVGFLLVFYWNRSNRNRKRFY
jgi:membrane associated rhomboid family serine protease